MPANVHDWLRDGEALHAALVKEYADLEQQIEDLEARLASKAAEANKLARILGLSPIESGRAGSGALVLSDEPDQDRPAAAASPAVTIHSAGRSLAGKFATERVMPGPGVSRIMDAIPGRHAT